MTTGTTIIPPAWGTTLAVGTIAFGLVAMFATGGLQVLAGLATAGLLGGTIVNSCFESTESDRKPTWPEAEQDAAVSRLEAAMQEPERKWVATLERAKSPERYH
jgi:hypothetical protein